MAELSWWQKFLVWGYVGGYWTYVITVAIILWPVHRFFDWASLVTMHVGIGTFWPIAAILWQIGYFTPN